jgi:hypothetical protein
MDAIEQAEQQKPGYMRDLLDKVLSYKDNGIKLTPEQIADPRAGLKAVVDHWADNLTWLHDKMPPELRDIAKQWYDSAHGMAQDIATKYGTTRQKVAASIAALSPQNAWDVNVGQAERIIKAYQTLQDHPWTPEMDQALSKKIADSLKGKNPQVEYANNLKKIRGKTFAQLENPKNPDVGNYNQALWTTMYEKAHGNPQTPTYAPDGTIRGYQTFNFGLLDGAAKALAILKGDGSPQSIHDIIGDGHKIRNFYNNIISPNSELGHATIDTHHVNADMLKPMSALKDVEVKDNFGGAPSHKGTGQKGTYSLHHEALKQAAAARGILPREMQSITWEGIKNLMGDEKKTPELRKAVTQIWQQHQAGELTLNEARDKIVKAAGGFDKPGWAKEREANAQSNTGSDEGRGSTPDETELPALGVRGESASGPRARSGGDISTPVPTEGTADARTQLEQLEQHLEGQDNVAQRVIDEYNSHLDDPKYRQRWSTAPASRLTKIWKDFSKTGLVTDEKGMEAITKTVLDNIHKLAVNTILAGHESIAPSAYAESVTGESHSEDHFEKLDHFFDDDKGNWRISDYAMKPLSDLAIKLENTFDPKEQLQLVDRVLNIVHQRSDLSSWFVEGGRKTLNHLSSGVDEGRGTETDWSKAVKSAGRAKK